MFAFLKANPVTEKIHVEMVIRNIETGQVTLRGALYYEMLVATEGQNAEAPLSGGSPGPAPLLSSDHTGNYSSITEGTKAEDIWARLNPVARDRCRKIIK